MSPDASLMTIFPSAAAAVSLRGAEVDAVLVELAEALARAHGLTVEPVVASLRERERLGSTAIGEGIALPHGRGEVEHTVGALGISAVGVQWAGARVHVVVALLSPLEGSEHVKALAKVGRLLGDPRLLAELRAAPDPARARALLVGRSP